MDIAYLLLALALAAASALFLRLCDRLAPR
jgi:hypothetical protein